MSILPDGKRSEVRSTLSLPVHARHHGANITCRAHNSALSAPETAALRLAVRFAPQVKLSADTLAVLERQDVTFSCAATANPSQVSGRAGRAGTGRDRRDSQARSGMGTGVGGMDRDGIDRGREGCYGLGGRGA